MAASLGGYQNHVGKDRRNDRTATRPMGSTGPLIWPPFDVAGAPTWGEGARHGDIGYCTDGLAGDPTLACADEIDDSSVNWYDANGAAIADS